MARKEIIQLEGRIKGRVSEKVCQVELPNGHTFLGFLGEKMQLKGNHILPDQKVVVELTVCDLSTGKIVRLCSEKTGP